MIHKVLAAGVMLAVAMLAPAAEPMKLPALKKQPSVQKVIDEHRKAGDGSGGHGGGGHGGR